MATGTKFEQFVEDLAHGVHDLGSDQLVVALMAAAPSAAADAVLGDITEIAYTNLSSRNLTTDASEQTDGLYTLVVDDLVLTASGAVETFRYVVIYNDTPTSPADPLIGFYDHGSDVTLASGETFTIDASAIDGLVTLDLAMPKALALLLARRDTRPPELEPEVLEPLSVAVRLPDVTFRRGFPPLQAGVMSVAVALQDLASAKGRTLAADVMPVFAFLQDLASGSGGSEHVMQPDAMPVAATLHPVDSSFAPFDPTAISDLVFWYDATLSTITEVSGAVSQVDDLSGNGNHAVQATAGNRGTLDEDAFGEGLDGIDFTADSMNTGENIANAGTFFAVAMPDVDTLDPMIGRGCTGNADNGAVLRTLANGSVQMIIGDGTARVNSTSPTGTYSAGDLVVVIGRWDADTVDLNFNGTNATQGSHSLGDLGGEEIGWPPAPVGSSSYHGQIAAGGYYDRRLNDQEVAFLMAYLLDRFPPTEEEEQVLFPILEPDGGPGTLVTTHKNLGEIDAATIRSLNTGGNARYDLRGTGKTIHLTTPPTTSQSDWQGKRCLAQMNNVAHSGAYIGGGWAICPEMTPDWNWDELYDSTNSPGEAVGFFSNGAAIHDVVVDGFRMHGTGFDGIAWGDASSPRTAIQRPVARRCAITMQRDDAFELDSRTIDTVLEDNYVEAFIFVSSRNPSSFNGSSRTHFIRRNLHKVLPCRIGGVANRIGATLKLDAKSPMLVLTDNIFAVPGGAVLHSSTASLFNDLINRNKLHASSSGNVICWLGSGSFPYAAPDGFTVLTGATAQTTWANALAAFWSTFPGHRFNIPGVVVDPAA